MGICRTYLCGFLSANMAVRHSGGDSERLTRAYQRGRSGASAAGGGGSVHLVSDALEHVPQVGAKQ